LAEELLEKIPPEKRWEITAKILQAFAVLRGEKRVAAEMGTGEGYILPVLGAEKWHELTGKGYSEEGAKKALPLLKEMFNIRVQDSIGAAKLIFVATRLVFGPEVKSETVEATPERVVIRYTKCSWWNRWKEHKLDHDVVSCYPPHEAGWKAGLKVINPKITYKLTKAMPCGDSFCEEVFEFKEE